MKTALLTLFFLLSASTIKLSLTSDEPILDDNGDFLFSNRQYYVVPPIWAVGGGLRPSKTPNSTCPVSVVQDPSLVSDGLPLTFTNVPDMGVVRTNTPLSIAFAEAPSCAESGKWILFKDLGDEGWSVGIGDAEDHPNRETLRVDFTIDKNGLGYRINFVSPLGSLTSGQIGRIFDEYGERPLIVSNKDPYEFVFKKASLGVSKI